MADAVFGIDFRNQRFTSAEKGLRYFAQAIGTGWDKAGPVLSKELKDYLNTVAEAMGQRHSGAWPGGTTINTLSRRSGKLTQAIKDSVSVSGTKLEDIEGRMVVKSVYARTQEYGATIVPKRAKYLTVPLPAALDARGVPIKAKARDWPNTFVITSKAGNLLIVQRRAGKIVPLYVLKTSVKIPARLGLRDTIEQTLPYFVERAMVEMLDAVRADL